MEKKVWFITGCSTGFGRALAQRTLALGYPTVCTARNLAQVEDLVAGHGDQGLALQLDVTDPGQIAAAVRAAADRFGTIDVLVNNAGIGYFGSMEESDLAEVRRMFEINLWGLAQTTREVLPLLRAQKSGTIVNISSIAGIAALPALSFYNATKFAVEGLSEALSQEVAPLGIKVLLVEPGPFRTDWAGRSAAEATETIADYRDTAGAGVRMFRGRSGRQAGDPVRAAAAIIQAVEAPEPPLRLLLGKVALANARKKVAALQKDFEGWAAVTEAADFPEQPQ
jgi:NAD(P)-dependent dehydrogenase (short-subunit alcohol dehydrogenase family)